MKLKMLIKDMKTKKIQGDTDIEISGLAYDSRKVKERELFIAIKGEKSDGHRFISDAINKGAAAVVYESLDEGMEKTFEKSVLINVKNSRDALAFISNNFYERPSERLNVIGITGTNGKTTTTYIMKSILEAAGRTAGLIGTINYIVREKCYEAPHTTPEAIEFQSILKNMAETGCSDVVTEVSSHALAQRRVDYTHFKCAVFTNLTRDHLDFHITMEDYFDAKKRLFNELLLDNGSAVINFDDVYGKKLIGMTKNKMLTYGMAKGADIIAYDVKDSFEGLRFKINFEYESHNIESALSGIHNIYNILAAAGAALSFNISWDLITEGIRQMHSVRGRFEKVDAGQEFLCIVDYAHTDDALQRLIITAKELMKNAERNGKIITVFGCGGNRDKGKRPKMGEEAARLSDYVVITSDNPRNEDPIEIINEIEKGMTKKNYLIEPDRRKAIKKAVSMAEKNDILLIAGKGHEDYQEIKGIRHKFSDREEAEKAIKERFKSV
ncbi:MAG: UDP-N-acetylmuramoyl-L-alanyl-D-glutamate--2,6-diaminopimelate ligase [Nitrospiraceae bacterium]|nr:UDP-N-acetylmuramoyl-L-alanyl-D-glutamate--2,6-diaminopimelate ligase [Nitrospiraceae bacterium]